MSGAKKRFDDWIAECPLPGVYLPDLFEGGLDDHKLDQQLRLQGSGGSFAVLLAASVWRHRQDNRLDIVRGLSCVDAETLEWSLKWIKSPFYP